MELPLTPLEFARRARALYAAREAVVDGSRRFTYHEFFSRCDRWASQLQRLGVRQGDRVAYIAPNIHGLLEAFYAVPQIGAVLVPVNYRLAAADFQIDESALDGERPGRHLAGRPVATDVAVDQALALEFGNHLLSG